MLQVHHPCRRNDVRALRACHVPALGCHALPTSRYYPRDWWHQTYNEEGENIAITGTIVDGLNFDSVSEELAKDSEREKPIIMAPSPELKKALPGCYAWLQEAYGGKLA